MSIVSLIIFTLVTIANADTSEYECTGDIRESWQCNGTTINDTDTNCLGYYSCQNAAITTQDLDCDGAHSCCHATITASEDVECDGKNACSQAVISAGDDIYCHGDEACEDAQLTAIDSVQCDGKEGCKYATITAPMVDCHGDEGCQEATISADDVFCYGRYGCDTAEIEAKYVEVFGYQSLYDATVTAKENELEVLMYGYAAGEYASIMCRAGDECWLHCDFEACNGTVLYCYSQSICYYDCGTNDVCPEVVTGLSDAETSAIYEQNKRMRRHNGKAHKRGRPQIRVDVKHDHKPYMEPNGYFSLSQSTVITIMMALVVVSVILIVLCFCMRNRQKREQYSAVKYETDYSDEALVSIDN